MGNQVVFQLHEIEELLSCIEAQGEAGKKAVNYTIKDIKSRAPGWVASEVASVYNIKKTEITPAKTAESNNKKAVSVYATGQTLETLSIVYRGRTLTPIHFSMTPKIPGRQKLNKKRAIPGKNVIFKGKWSGDHAVGLVPVYKKYSISFAVFKGSRWKIRGKSNLRTPFLAPIKKGSDKYIAYQRLGEARTKMYSVRTVSVPQMLGNSHVQSKIDEKIMEATKQRLQHHLDRFAPKE